MSLTMICDNRNDPFHKALAMSDKLSQVNRILDRTCKKAGLDPVEVRLAMIQTIQGKLVHGKGFDRLPPSKEAEPGPLSKMYAKVCDMEHTAILKKAAAHD